MVKTANQVVIVTVACRYERPFGTPFGIGISIWDVTIVPEPNHVSSTVGKSAVNPMRPMKASTVKEAGHTKPALWLSYECQLSGG